MWWQNDCPSEVRIVENWEFLMRWVDGCFIVPCRAVPRRAVCHGGVLFRLCP